MLGFVGKGLNRRGLPAARPYQYQVSYFFRYQYQEWIAQTGGKKVMVRRVTSFINPKKNLGEKYTPIYFLAALGNGGLAISFFIYLNFLVPHPETPIVTFDVLAAFMNGASMPIRALVLTAMAGILFFFIRHVRLLVWNLREYARYRKTQAFVHLRQSNNESKLIGLPLTLAMLVNAGFATGAAFIPGLWNIVEYLFPIAMLAFLAVGIVAIRIFMTFFSRIIASPEFDCTYNNSLAQLKAVLTFAMVGVGLSAPAAMSATQATVAASIVGAIFFLSIALVLGFILFIMGFRSMLAHGINKESAVSLWIPIPILTVIGVAIIRMLRGLSFLFYTPDEAFASAAQIVAARSAHFGDTIFVWTALIMSLQVLFAIMGYAVMQRVGYFKTFVSGDERSVDSYALICPGTAMFVYGMFFVHNGLVKPGFLEKFSTPYFIMLIPLVASQIFAIATMMRLDEKLLRPEPEPSVGDTEMAVA